MQRYVYLISLVSAASACSTQPDLEAARQAIMEADRAFAVETAANGVEGWVSFFAEDGVQFVPGGHISGHAAIRELMTTPLSNPALLLFTWDPVDARVSASGDLGYTIGRWERVMETDGGQIVATGSYVSIWRLQEDGTWKVELDIGSPDEG